MNLQAGWMGLVPAVVPLLLFAVRAADLTLATLRVFSIIRGRPALAWFLGFFEAVLFVLGAAGLLLNLTNPAAVVGYAAGFASGSAIGLTFERRFLPGNSLIRIYSPGRGSAIATALRDAGRGATEVGSRGLSGTLDTIFTFIRRRDENRLRKMIRDLDTEAVTTVESVRVLAGGWRA